MSWKLCTIAAVLAILSPMALGPLATAEPLAERARGLAYTNAGDALDRVTEVTPLPGISTLRDLAVLDEGATDVIVEVNWNGAGEIAGGGGLMDVVVRELVNDEPLSLHYLGVGDDQLPVHLQTVAPSRTLDSVGDTTDDAWAAYFRDVTPLPGAWRVMRGEDIVSSYEVRLNDVEPGPTPVRRTCDGDNGVVAMERDVDVTSRYVEALAAARIEIVQYQDGDCATDPRVERVGDPALTYGLRLTRDWAEPLERSFDVTLVTAGMKEEWSERWPATGQALGRRTVERTGWVVEPEVAVHGSDGAAVGKFRDVSSDSGTSDSIDNERLLKAAGAGAIALIAFVGTGGWGVVAVVGASALYAYATSGEEAPERPYAACEATTHCVKFGYHSPHSTTSALSVPVSLDSANSVAQTLTVKVSFRLSWEETETVEIWGDSGGAAEVYKETRGSTVTVTDAVEMPV